MRIAPTTCWHGNVDQIENFWAGSQPSYDRSKSGLSSSASDYVQLQPCCGTDASAMYNASPFFSFRILDRELDDSQLLSTDPHPNRPSGARAILVCTF